MKKLMPFLVVLVAVGAGGAGALMLDAPAEDVHAAEEGAKTPVSKHEGKKEAVAYMGFQRAFIVPVVVERNVSALVMLDLSLEMDAATVENARKKEPKLRDGIMKALIGLSHEGMLTGDITDPAVYEEIRNRIEAAAGEYVGEGLQGVLITDYARQER
ncbi:flagellar basal body-associated FliL family protein [Parvularcula oceani]|uniref:flagellar basal body-associated FliL family protein n=1 Tax=Parvularcula oceani TaxID=1247963 RepID=UPI0004E188F3|nr:flagellar basal body-associated FliL family protein [Parvularcula oceani]